MDKGYDKISKNTEGKKNIKILASVVPAVI